MMRAEWSSPSSDGYQTGGPDIITWIFERSDLRQGATKAGCTSSSIRKALNVLARKLGILGIFSDRPATVTYYANCMGLK